MDAFWDEYLRVLNLCKEASTVSATTHWTAYLTAAATSIVAVFGAWIAYRQLQTAHDKLRLDLFERRLVVYEAVRTTFGELLTRGRLNHEDEAKYLIGIQGAKWLFDPVIQEYLDETLWQKLLAHRFGDEQLQDTPPGPDRVRLAEERAIMWKWFREQMGNVDDMFMPYMRFDHRKQSIVQFSVSKLAKLRRR